MSKTCRGCGREIKDGEARYTGAEYRGVFWHHACHKEHFDAPNPREALKRMADEMKSLEVELQRRLTGRRK